MNERIKELADQAGFIASAPTLSPTLEKFAELIIQECQANPKVYLLQKKDATKPDSHWEVYAWTSDLQKAKKWREHHGRDERHEFLDLYYLKEMVE
jgi:hypothetical protein